MRGVKLGACRDGSSRRAGRRCGRLFSRAGGMCAGAAAPTPGRSITWCRSSWAAATIWPICGRRVAAAIRARAQRWAIACGVSAGMAAKGLLASPGGPHAAGDTRRADLRRCDVTPSRRICTRQAGITRPSRGSEPIRWGVSHPARWFRGGCDQAGVTWMVTGHVGDSPGWVAFSCMQQGRPPRETPR
jgi:hypothetical protein